jgi:hypothetical protein
MICQERYRLWEQYNSALSAFSQAVDELTESKPGGFTEKVPKAQQANVACKAARAAWEQHIREHKCSE